MCGITGWIDYQRDLTREQAIIEAMTATMVCRGPDTEGIWLSPHAAIGHRRLAVIDIEGGAQPMQSSGGPAIVLTFSGEIYNFPELRAELEGYGHSFRTRSDSEVLLEAYRQWGVDCLSRLNGMFAFAIWDEATQELFLARDRLGIKPLYYVERPTGILFGSEPKAILAQPEFRPEIDAEGLAELFAQAGTKTPGHGIFRGLREVKPGWFVRVSRDGVRTAPYWELEARQHTDDLATTIATVRELLWDTVERQMVADVPLATLLSGGLDSSALTALAAAIQQRTGRGPVDTFSVDFAGSQEGFHPDRLRPSHDEPYAQCVARHVGSRHRTILLDAEDLVGAQAMPRRAHDLPAMGDLYVSMYLLFRDLRRHATVALSGESADEVFGGYPWYHDPRMLAAPTYPWAARGSWAGLLCDDVRGAVRLDDYAADRYTEALAEVPRLPGECAEERRIREVLYLGLKRWLPLLLDRKDRLSMAVGLEVRVPFCDHRLVEYVWNVPWSMKELGGREKGLLRAAVDGMLPLEVLNRRKSIYPAAIEPNYDQEMREQLRCFLDQVNAPLFALIDRDKLASAFAADPTLPGMMAIQPSPMAAAAFLLDIDAWLRDYQVRIV